MSDGKGTGKVKLQITVYAPCKKHKHWVTRRLLRYIPFPRYVPLSTQFCGCSPDITAQTVCEDDLQTTAWAQLGITNLLAGGSQTIKDTGGIARSIPNNSAASAITIVAGSGTTTPTVADNVLTTPITGSSGSTTVVTAGGSLTESGSSGTYTITGTLTNSSGGNLTYAEIGVTVTVATFIFLILHDLTNGATGYVVSNNGTAAVTYTITNQ